MNPKNFRILRVPAFTENYRENYDANAIANEIHDLSARAKFPYVGFQLPLLIISKIVADLKLVYRKMEKMNSLD